MNILSILVSLLLAISHCSAEDDYYEILGVTRSATSYEIKKAYRKKALKEHPDMNRDDPDANERFQKVNKAYEVLSDDDKKKAYDRCGVKCVEREGSMDHTDPFASFFGDFGFSFGGEDRGPRDTPKGGTITMDLFVTLEELYNGNFIEVCIKIDLIPSHLLASIQFGLLVLFSAHEKQTSHETRFRHKKMQLSSGDGHAKSRTWPLPNDATNCEFIYK